MIVFFHIKKKRKKNCLSLAKKKICHVGLEGGIYPLPLNVSWEEGANTDAYYENSP